MITYSYARQIEAARLGKVLVLLDYWDAALGSGDLLSQHVLVYCSKRTRPFKVFVVTHKKLFIKLFLLRKNRNRLKWIGRRNLDFLLLLLLALLLQFLITIAVVHFRRDQSDAFLLVNCLEHGDFALLYSPSKFLVL